MAQTLKQLQTRYGEKVRRVFRQFPLNSIHPNAQKAAEASLCANEQNRFWEMFDRLFESPRRLEASALRQKASEIGLDTEEFDACLGSGRYSEQVRKDLRAGVLAGVSGTPAVFVNGRPVQGNASFQTISELIDEELSRR